MPGIFLRLKRLGKKRLRTVPYRVPEGVITLADLLAEVVRREVESFNAYRDEPKLFAFLTPADIEEQSSTGKVAFGDITNKTKADYDEALQNVLQAHTDGVFLVYLADELIEDLHAPLALVEDSELTFLRLTFLTGLLWK